MVMKSALINSPPYGSNIRCTFISEILVLRLCSQVIFHSIKDNGQIVGDNDLIFGTSYEFGGTAAPAGTRLVGPIQMLVYC